jgi:hypothetical protein
MRPSEGVHLVQLHQNLVLVAPMIGAHLFALAVINAYLVLASKFSMRLLSS